MWHQIIDIFAARGRIGPGLRTCCSRHPNHYSDVYAPEGFDQVQDCNVQCGEVRACGHTCQERCHPPELHERLPCTSPCKTIHPCGHQCLKLCSESCGLCRYPIKQQVQPCGHPVDVFCSGALPTCTKIISTVPLPCGHHRELRCCDKGKPYSCGEKCGQYLLCGHPCQGLCADCRSSPCSTHRPCSNQCGAKLQLCGHYCDSECHSGSPCPPCKQPCQQSCAHGHCKNLCSEPCDPCIKPHQKQCSHQAQSSLLCSLPSDILPCCEPCNKGESCNSYSSLDPNLSLVLPCGHACPSLCGEVCPTKVCPQCVSGIASTTAILACPTCHGVLDIKDLDRRLISNIYTLDGCGNITGFASGSPEGPMDLNCVCGTPFYGLRRYSILKQLSQTASAFVRLLSKLGKGLNTFSRRIHYHEKELEESFHSFRDQIRPNPLAGNQNRALVASRAQRLLRLSDSIEDYNNSVAMAFEQSIMWIQTTLPTALLQFPSWPAGTGLRTNIFRPFWPPLTPQPPPP